jgi:hypothetical protein
MTTIQVLPGPEPVVDLDDARRFLDLLEPGGGEFTFQTFDDRKGGKNYPALNRVLHGRFDEHAETLRELNDKGAGIFVMVNAGDGEIHEGAKTCRTAANVIRVRALFVDLDGSPLEPVLESGPHPDIVVNSSPGRYHAYWCVEDCPLNRFTSTQKSIAEKFSGDPVVHDLARVMRVPGFLHRKGDPFVTRVIHPKRTAQ